MIAERTKMLIGEESVHKLEKSHVAVFGVGGVGGYVVEALARAGVGQLTIVDNDVVTVSNINRQLIALHSTIGKPKVLVCKERCQDINPNLIVHSFQSFVSESNINDLMWDYDYVVDCIDTVSAKVAIIEKCSQKNIKVICCLGTGNKICTDKLKIADIFSTHTCPLARDMRSLLKAKNIKTLKVVFSEEKPIKPLFQPVVSNKKFTPASISFVPGTAGLILAGEVIRELVK